jgi:hypothetical protein
MRNFTLKKRNSNRANSIPFKKVEAITSNDIKLTFSKTKELTEEEINSIKNWLNNFLALSYKTWKSKQSIVELENKNYEQEESHIIYPSEYRRAS